MKRYTKRDKEILIALRRVLPNYSTPDKRTIMKSGRILFKQVKAWSNGFNRLLEKELLEENKTFFSFTRKGKKLADKFYKDYCRRGFNRELLRCMGSKAYSEICKLVYGMNLCQCSMMNMKQLNRLVSILKLNANDRVLDVSCGIGQITEYISDITGACILGIDLADKVIEKARKRAKSK